MRLVSVELKGYRRFESAKCRLEGHILAVVGPNEAGKTSLLRALQRMEDTEPILPADRTSQPEGPLPSDAVIGLQFRLEDDDYAAVAGIGTMRDTRWLELFKNADGGVWARLAPRPSRDSSARLRLAKDLRKASRKLPLRNDYERKGQVEQVASALDSAGELGVDEVASLRSLSERLSEVPEGGVDSLRAQIDELVLQEEGTHPADEAAAILQLRVPRFAWFGEAERSLQSEYDVAELNPRDPPAALANLARLAQLDLRILKSRFGDMPQRQSLLDRANTRPKSVFHEAWHQSSLSVGLYADGNRLLVHAHDDGIGYTRIDERSEGARAYVALYCFLQVQASKRRTILLVDEAESHLHYEAQADLIRAFTRQRDADVIYTTHSAGCLPEDLGTGIRVVEPGAGRRSTLLDHFWSSERGFTGLLLAMGASALAFTPTRRAVIAEGPTETALLPTLMREALNVEHLGFQVAPGLSEITPSGVASLRFEAASVAYVVDNDEGGRAVKAKLVSAGIPGHVVVALGGGSRSVATLEDVLSTEVFAAAVNESLARSGKTLRIRASEVPTSERWRWLRARCKAAKTSEPDKMDVANFVAWYADSPRLSVAGKSALVRLHAHLESLLGLAPLNPGPGDA